VLPANSAGTIDPGAFHFCVVGPTLSHMMRLLRFVILLVMTGVVILFIIAVVRPETGPAEKGTLSLAIVGVLVAARPVQRYGSGRA